MAKAPKSRTIKTIERKREELEFAIGKAISAWSGVEHALASAFSHVVSSNHPTIAYEVFFSARAFNGKHDMLLTAIKARMPHESHPEYARLALIKSGLKKAEKWARTRNQIAHERPIVTAQGKHILTGNLAPNIWPNRGDARDGKFLTTQAILQCARNYTKLNKIIRASIQETRPSSQKKLLERVRQLPPIPYSDSLELHATRVLARQQKSSPP